jgi:WS/DGAT/MGAT family acyltransferase
MSSDERMAPVDVTWLRMDRPNNHMVIVGVIVLREPVDLERLERTLEARMLVHDRFRRKVEERGGAFLWRDDPRFDIGRHLRRARLPGAGGKAELQRFVGELAVQPLDPRHALWQIHIVERYDEGVALVLRIHHAIGDGAAMMRVLLDLTDESPDAPLHGADWAPEDEGEEADHAFRPPWEALAPLIGKIEDGARSAFDLARNPSDARKLLRDGANVAAELAWLLLMPMDTPTRLKGALCGDKQVAWSAPIPLPEVKAVGHALGCTVNDMLLSAFAGALKTYLEAKGDDTAGVEVRALAPIDLRPPGRAKTLGNQFGIVAVELPVGMANPLARLEEVRRRMLALKRSYEPVVTLGLITALGYGPKMAQDRLFDLLLSRATAVMTNVPGPQRPLWLGGGAIDQIMFWVPQSGEIGMGVSLLSFNNRVQLGLITDAALTPDPDEIVKHFQPEFEQLLYHALLHCGEDVSAATAPPRPARKRKPKPAVLRVNDAPVEPPPAKRRARAKEAV